MKGLLVHRFHAATRLWYNVGMKRTLCLTAFCVAVSALGMVSERVSLGVSSFADTEVSTNMPPPVRVGDPLVFGFEIDFCGSPSNSVEIAFGTDASGDGTLAPEETDLVFGWNCGEWFVRSESADVALAEPSLVPCGQQTLSVAARIERDGHVASFAAGAGGAPVFAGLAAAPPAWIHDRAWNLCRLTARGVDVSGASCLVSSTPYGFKILVR